MWDFDSNRSSGGIANQRAIALIGKTLFITPDVNPEYSGLIPLLLIFTLSFKLILRKKIKGNNQKK